MTDNTNADPNTRAEWVRVAKESNVPIRCVYFTSSPELCKHNNAVRAANRSLVPLFSSQMLETKLTVYAL